MSQFPVSLTGDPVDYSKVLARFVPVQYIQRGDIVYHKGGWKRVGDAGPINMMDGSRRMVIGSDISVMFCFHNICRKGN